MGSTHEDRNHEHQRRKEMHDGVGAKRNNVFLGERLDAIGDWLQKTVGADAIRPNTILDPAQPLALEDRCEREEAGKDADDGDDAE